MPEQPTPPNFDRIARPYRWLEYLTLGPLLERCRLHFLPQLLHSRRALVLGDGDGRFLARLLVANPRLHADAVDLSPAMLHLLRGRTLSAGSRLSTHQADALTFRPTHTYDLVVTHFFLDCLTGQQLHLLLRRLAPNLTPDARWLLSDFRIPAGPLRPLASALVRLLYFAFRLLTGLRPDRLPDYALALRGAGFTPLTLHRSLGGILTSEIWQRHPEAASRHPTGTNAVSQEIRMTTPSPVPDVPATPGTDLPSSPVSDPIPSPEPPAPSLPDPNLGILDPTPVPI